LKPLNTGLFIARIGACRE